MHNWFTGGLRSSTWRYGVVGDLENKDISGRELCSGEEAWGNAPAPWFPKP